MPQTILYIASSLDGFIAKPDGNLDWLTSTPNPDSGDYGYEELLNRIGTLYMGRKTYEAILGFGIEWPYAAYKTYVISTQNNLSIQTPNTELLSEHWEERVRKINESTTKDSWLVGGGHLINAFLREELIDKMIITIIPQLIGEGIPLFAGKTPTSTWHLTESKAFNTGVVNLSYEKERKRLM